MRIWPFQTWSRHEKSFRWAAFRKNGEGQKGHFKIYYTYPSLLRFITPGGLFLAAWSGSIYWSREFTYIKDQCHFLFRLRHGTLESFVSFFSIIRPLRRGRSNDPLTTDFRSLGSLTKLSAHPTKMYNGGFLAEVLSGRWPYTNPSCIVSFNYGLTLPAGSFLGRGCACPIFWLQRRYLIWCCTQDTSLY